LSSPKVGIEKSSLFMQEQRIIKNSPMDLKMFFVFMLFF